VKRARRERSDVTLVAVTKKFPASLVLEAFSLGLRHFGENSCRSSKLNTPALANLNGDGAEFHFIGHLQSNKNTGRSGIVQVIETVDFRKTGAPLGSNRHRHSK